jgi:hypothetical protein
MRRRMHQRMTEVFGDRAGMLVWELHHHAQTMQAFDVTFYDREPILNVTLNDSWARDFCTAFLCDRRGQHIGDLLKQIIFSDGATADLHEIWTLNYMPTDLDTADVDLAQGERVIGQGGETLREVICQTYHCKSRAEEDFFLARWIAS